MRLSACASLVAAGLALAGSTHAQAPRLSDGVTLPWQALASEDTSAATYVNPANLAWQPGPEGRATVVWTPEDAPLPLRGYALDLAAPLWIFGTGIRIDWMDPPDSAVAPFAVVGDGRPTGWVRWGLAVRPVEALSVGTTMAWSFSEAPELHDHFSVTSGATLRLNRFVSGALVVRDWNAPENDFGQTIEPSVDFGATLRPIDGERALELGLEGSYRGQDDSWVPSANAAVALPYVGRLRLGAQIIDPSNAELVAMAGLEVNLDTLQATGGAVFGNALKPEGTGFAASLAFRDYRDPYGIPLPARVVRIRFEATPGVRGHIRLLERLWSMAEDDEVDGIMLVLRADAAPTMAHAQELIDALELLRANGKKIICHLEDASGRDLHVCSAADAIAMNPAGGLRFAGLSARYFYLGGLLDKLGVQADFVRIGKHKLAAEQFSRGPTDVANADHVELLQEYEGQFVSSVAAGRDLDVATARANIAKGPFIATEARAAELIDALVYEDELDRYAEEVFGRPVAVVDLATKPAVPDQWRSPPKIAVVYLHGNMVDGNSRNIPILDIRLAGSYTIAKALKQAREDSSIKAVVFRIETGGGSSLASDVILREAMLTAKQKPLIVSMGSAAASGGYYASVAGQEIFANPATLTGSIGIFYGKVDVSGLLQMLGVRQQSFRSTPKADAESFYRPFTDQEHRDLGVKVKQFYDLFIGRVAEGRDMEPAAVDAVARGKVWSGRQAKEKGLVDELGGIRQALDRARELGELPADAPLVHLPPEDKSLLELALELVGVPSLQADESGWIPPPLHELARVLVPLALMESYKPMALMETVIFE